MKVDAESRFVRELFHKGVWKAIVVVKLGRISKDHWHWSGGVAADVLDVPHAPTRMQFRVSSVLPYH